MAEYVELANMILLTFTRYIGALRLKNGYASGRANGADDAAEG